jgi:hypothetical protein
MDFAFNFLDVCEKIKTKLTYFYGHPVALAA